MFFTLLIVTFALSVIVSFGVATVFKKPIGDIFNRIIQDAISTVWQKYIMFATYVVGISGGVRIYDLERYISAPNKDMEILQLTAERCLVQPDFVVEADEQIIPKAVEVARKQIEAERASQPRVGVTKGSDASR